MPQGGFQPANRGPKRLRDYTYVVAWLQPPWCLTMLSIRPVGKASSRHPREGGDPWAVEKTWTPAFAGVTLMRIGVSLTATEAQVQKSQIVGRTGLSRLCVPTSVLPRAAMEENR